MPKDEAQVVLTADNLNKSIQQGDDSHQQQTILNNLSLTVHAGESIAILGRSGTGKSTLLNALAGITPVDKGNITFCGKTVNQLTEREKTLMRRENIGYIFQFFNLVPTLTVKENILLPLQLNKQYNTADQQLNQQLSQLGIKRLEDRYPQQLSGGEQQRVAILRALIHRPKLILADEPTGSLDLETGNQVAEILFNSVTEDSALIVVTHSEEIAARAQTVYRLVNGKLVQEK
ncbi:ABC transporter ATP-binding protein [Sessilibacter corallicola]|uniref:ABC transporter ATP-binding protein n=1 Tax=Sessilibacter corallicola TaxID=2904075 RepID=A0ABQ0A6R9_9GAMM|nr:ABC transporter ATP-binding protein [Sessilibacter corallicola]MCE2028557.1 ABC transporter ATP-binding protein [Sessilibacter corallicola]